MKKIGLLLVLVFTIFITGCKNTNDNEETTTLSNKLAYSFEEAVKKESDIKKLGEILSKNESLDITLEVVEIKGGDYIPGFKEEIKGFNKAVEVRPIIGTIPFIMYIFEVDNAQDFASTLESNAQLNWNICTEADEMKTSVYENYVFFVMTPSSFEE